MIDWNLILWVRVRFLLKCMGLWKQKIDNPVRIITGGCNNTDESLSIYVEKVLFDISNLAKIRDIYSTNCMILFYQLIQYF